MARFKPGDKVRRTGYSYGSVRVGEIYDVFRCTESDALRLKGHFCTFDARCFELVSREPPCTPAELFATIDLFVENLTNFVVVGGVYQNNLSGYVYEVVAKHEDYFWCKHVSGSMYSVHKYKLTRTSWTRVK